MDDFVGRFAKNNDVLDFSVIDGKLICYDQYDDKDYECILISENIVISGSVLVEFLRDENGVVDKIRINKGTVLEKKE